MLALVCAALADDQTQGHTSAQEGHTSAQECDAVGCGWTAQWACPAAATKGSTGFASDDGTLEYRCCCGEASPDEQASPDEPSGPDEQASPDEPSGPDEQASPHEPSGPDEQAENAEHVHDTCDANAKARRAFDAFDLEGTSRISVSELEAALLASGVHPTRAQLNASIAACDAPDGKIGFDDFCQIHALFELATCTAQDANQRASGRKLLCCEGGVACHEVRQAGDPWPKPEMWMCRASCDPARAWKWWMHVLWWKRPRGLNTPLEPEEPVVGQEQGEQASAPQEQEAPAAEPQQQEGQAEQHQTEDQKADEDQLAEEEQQQ